MVSTGFFEHGVDAGDGGQVDDGIAARPWPCRTALASMTSPAISVTLRMLVQAGRRQRVAPEGVQDDDLVARAPAARRGASR